MGEGVLAIDSSLIVEQICLGLTNSIVSTHSYEHEERYHIPSTHLDKCEFSLFLVAKTRETKNFKCKEEGNKHSDDCHLHL